MNHPLKTTFYVKFKLTSDDIPENTSLRRRMMMSKPSYRKTKRFKTLAEAEQFCNQKLKEGKDPRISSCETIKIWRNKEQNDDRTA